MTRLLRSLLVCLLLARSVWGSINTQVFWENVDADVLVVRGFTDPDVCNQRLLQADDNEDFQLDQEEFMEFAKLSGPNDFMSDIDEYQDLPLAFRTTFVALSCLCSDSAKTNCCNDQVDISGADGDADMREANDLFLICSLTRIAVDRILASITPSASPTEAGDPTASPTEATDSPTTLAPTPLPTAVPSPAPTMKPSPGPTIGPTPSPTLGPSRLPTIAPTPLPTLHGSSLPTSQPSPFPTLAISSLPTALPTLTASASPSEPLDPTTSPSPTEAPVPAVTLAVDYRVGVSDGVFGAEYSDELIGAMDALAPEVLSLGGRRLHLRSRRLQSVVLPTSIDSFSEDECATVLPSEDGCASVQASIMLQFQPEDDMDQAAVAAQFRTQIQDAIASGELQDKLDTLYPETEVYIIDDELLAGLVGARGIGDDEGGLEAGGIAGVVVASVALVGFFLLYAAAAKRRGEGKEDLEPLDPAPRDLSFLEDELNETHSKGITVGQLGATTPDYHVKKKHRKSPSSPHRSPHRHHGDHDSDAGDSGWSSSAGVSSLNTGDRSGDELDFENNQMAGSLGSPSRGSAPDAGEGNVPNTPGSVTRSDLDSAIEAGDWAAVGATAALLAAGSDTASFSSRSLTGAGTSTRDGSTVSSYEAARAAELDHLVDAGDWEGVVFAAAQFEASSTVASDSGSRMSKSGDGGSSMASSSVSKSKKQQDYREQVEDLVQRIVPEEAENVDEMMLQFRGREEELVETLRTMQERQVAQKARQGAQKAAKVEAKQTAIDKKSLLGLSGAAPASTRSLGTGQVTPKKAVPDGRSLGSGSVEASAKSLGTGSIFKKNPPSAREKKQTNLERAIEAGDWEAVGEAAAMLNDASSASSADTDEINRLADGLSSQGSNVSADSEKRATRAEELDQLIDQGDWMGVVQAAADFESEEDPKATKKKSWLGKKQKKEEQETRKVKQLKRLQAEQEALQQAEIWMAIADKSKDDSQSGDRGAMDAADWAIGRSLAALVEAEGTSHLQGSDVGSSNKDSAEIEDEV